MSDNNSNKDFLKLAIPLGVAVAFALLAAMTKM